MTNKTLVLSIVGTFMIVAGNRAFAKHQFPKPHILVGIAIAYLFLGFVAELGKGGEQLAATFGVLILVGVTLTQGKPVFDGITKTVGGK